MVKMFDTCGEIRILSAGLFAQCRERIMPPRLTADGYEFGILALVTSLAGNGLQMSASSPQHDRPDDRSQSAAESKASGRTSSRRSLGAARTLPAQISSSRFREAALLTAQLEAAIRRATGDRVRNLRVTWQDDCVTIRGRCATFYCKQMAQQAALALLAHEALVNGIEVY